MTIQYCSDLHLEFPENKGFLKENPIIPTSEILILAGDIVPFKLLDKHEDFFNFCSDNFKETYWIPGNHEYYGFDINQKSGTFHEKIKSNVHLLNNITIEGEETSLIFSTLWSKINPAHQWQIEHAMNDFHVIKDGNKRFTSDRFNALHEQSMQFLSKALLETNYKNKVVVTHHVPTLQYYPQQYKGSILNDAFAVELTDFIELYKPDYWIYGHHHQHTADFQIGETKLLTNQLGYVEMKEHIRFDASKKIEL